MTLTALITRPVEDAEKTSAALAERGIKSLITPLLTIAPIQEATPNLTDVQALLFTSANGVRAFGALSPERTLPALCVGAASAEAAKEIGFSEVKSAHGDVDDLAALAQQLCTPEEGLLYHGAGKMTAGDLQGSLSAAGFTIRKEKLYEAIPVPSLPQEAAQALRQGHLDLALFYSPRTAETFLHLTSQAGLQNCLKRLTAYCLSTNVENKLQGAGFHSLRTAFAPDQNSLLRVLDDDLGKRDMVADQGHSHTSTN